MDIFDLPYYTFDNDEMFDHYIRDLRLIKDVGSLRSFISTWYFFWECIEDRHQADKWILGYDVDTGTVTMLNKLLKITDDGWKEEVRMDPEFGNRKDVLTALNLIVPESTLVSLKVAKAHQIPFCVALHQIFCKSKDHRGCY